MLEIGKAWLAFLGPAEKWFTGAIGLPARRILPYDAPRASALGSGIPG